jgi:cell wall-associated NlpC family hydrolase
MKQCSANSLPSASHVPGSSVEHREEPVEGRPLASNAFTNAAPSATRSRAKDQQQANLPEQAPKPTKSSTTRRPKARDNTQRPAPAAREPAAQSTSTSRRPQTRSSTSKFFDTPSEPTFSPVASEPERGRLPKLTQGTSHIKTYYATACATFEGVDITGAQTEIDYISAFIKGLREDKHQSKLTEALQQFHPSRVRDGRIEILCEWEDMREGLIKAGLLGSKEKDKSVAGKKKGRLLSSENLFDYRY